MWQPACECVGQTGGHPQWPSQGWSWNWGRTELAWGQHKWEECHTAHGAQVAAACVSPSSVLTGVKFFTLLCRFLSTACRLMAAKVKIFYKTMQTHSSQVTWCTLQAAQILETKCLSFQSYGSIFLLLIPWQQILRFSIILGTYSQSWPRALAWFGVGLTWQRPPGVIISSFFQCLHTLGSVWLLKEKRIKLLIFLLNLV